MSAKLPCLIGAIFLFSGVAAFPQATISTGAQVVGPAGSAISTGPLGTTIAPGPSVSISGLGTPGTGGTLIAPGPTGSLFSPIQNLPPQALIPPGCSTGGFATTPLSLSSIFPSSAIPGIDTPVIPFDRPIGC
jgi:hypothetical protein